MPRPRASRADIIALLQEGRSNNYIVRTLHTRHARVAAIRAELGLPPYKPAPTLTIRQKWDTNTRRVTGGHVMWTGGTRGITANITHDGRNHSVRRIAFELGNGRPPVGRVLPGCGMQWCVAPEHATDSRTRRSDAAYAQIFGRAA